MDGKFKGLVVLAAWVSIALQSGAWAQDRQALIERFRQARANGTLGHGGLMRGLNVQARQPQIDPQGWEKVDRKLDLAYGSEPLQKLDVYMPKEKEKTGHPLLLFLHGGGWRIGDKKQHGGKGVLFAQNGIVFVNADYGLAPKVVHPQQVLDVARAIRYSIEHAAEWGGDPDRIFLMGHSAGAHLVDLVATNQRFLREAGVNPKSIKGVISLDTASLDLLKRTKEESVEGQHVGAMIEQAFGKDPARLKDGSPTLSIHKGNYYPPFLMYCGEKRKTCLEQHEAFACQLKNAGGSLAVKAVPLSHRNISMAAGDGESQIFRESRAFIESGKL